MTSSQECETIVADIYKCGWHMRKPNLYRISEEHELINPHALIREIF